MNSRSSGLNASLLHCSASAVKSNCSELQCWFSQRREQALVAGGGLDDAVEAGHDLVDVGVEQDLERLVFFLESLHDGIFNRSFS